MPARAALGLALDDATWRAFAARDRVAGGGVFAVRTTGVFCRAGCPARTPRRENVALFRAAGGALAAGFRPCLRCRPLDGGADPRVAAVARACARVDEAPGARLDLADLARAAGMSPSRLHRAFVAVAGVTPRAYVEARRLLRMRRALRAGAPVAQAASRAGFASVRRAHGKAAEALGMAPGAFRRGAAGEGIVFATAPSSLGLVLVAATARGVCSVRLGRDAARLEAQLRAEFPRADVRPDGGRLGPWVAEVLAALDGRPPHPGLPLDVRGTVFQRRVWDALRSIPRGATRTYAEVAREVGLPGAARAVGAACGANPVPFVVPCHRVVASSGGLGGYRWGLPAKRALLAREREPA